jgi:hypothetical protein
MFEIVLQPGEGRMSVGVGGRSPHRRSRLLPPTTGLDRRRSSETDRSSFARSACKASPAVPQVSLNTVTVEFQFMHEPWTGRHAASQGGEAWSDEAGERCELSPYKRGGERAEG